MRVMQRGLRALPCPTATQLALREQKPIAEDAEQYQESFQRTLAKLHKDERAQGACQHGASERREGEGILPGGSPPRHPMTPPGLTTCSRVGQADS